TDGVGELHVRDDAAAEERAAAPSRAVDELVGDDDVSRRDLLAQASDGAHRDYPFRTELLHPVEVGAERKLRGEQSMPAPVARQEDEPRAAEAADHELVGGIAEGRLEPHPLDGREAGQLVEPAAADDTERGFCHAAPWP